MVADHIDIRFILEIGIIDSEVGVEPVDFAGDELLGNEALEDEEGQKWNCELEESEETFAATSAWTWARCSSLPLNTGVEYPGRFLTLFTEESLDFGLCPGTSRLDPGA